MIGGVVKRLAYFRLLLRAGTWRWLLARLDFVVMDHVTPWTRLARPRSSTVHPSVSFRRAENVVLGENTRIQNNCVLWASPGSTITIGESSGLGPGTMIYSSNHQFVAGIAYHKQAWTERDVTVGRDVWVGAGSIILPGVTIGDGCVVAAGSVVTKDVPPNSIVAGVPARVIRER